MRCQFLSVCCGTLRARRIVPPFIPMIGLAVGVLLLPSIALGGTQQSTGPIPAGDDWNSASLNPYPAIPVSTIGSIPPGQCAWINAGTAAFAAANPGTAAGAALDGTGSSGQGWTFTWAGAAVEAQVEAGIGITDYYPWVVNQPAVNVANGARFGSASPLSGQLSANPYNGAGNIGEVGGAVFNIQYAPQPGAGHQCRQPPLDSGIHGYDLWERVWAHPGQRRLCAGESGRLSRDPGRRSRRL